MDIVVDIPEWVPRGLRAELADEIEAAVREAIMIVWSKNAPGVRIG